MEKFRRYAMPPLRWTYRILEVFLFVISTWLVMAILLPHIRVNTDYRSPKDGVTIFIRSNGVHTDFVVPLRNRVISWDSVFDPGAFNADTTYPYVALGWGDKGFFLNTPTWDDLTLSTALTAVSGVGESAMHVDYLGAAPREGMRTKSYIISEVQYRNLIAYVRASFISNTSGVMLIDHAGYAKHDRFFEANGRYSLFKTCNEWTGDGMQACGLPVGIWTPLEFGIMDVK